jgi:hypothetical protein
VVATAPAPRTAATAATLAVVTYTRKADPRPRRHLLPWTRLAARLIRHDERPEKDGAMWSPVELARGTTRKNTSVTGVTCFVGDLDGEAPPRERLAGLGLAHVMHTTHSHLHRDAHNPTGGPRWRVVVPLCRRVPAKDWPAFWLRARAHLCPGSAMDTGCKDASRAYYLPSCRPGAPRHAEAVAGAPLDPATVPELPPEEARRPARAAPVGEVIPAGRRNTELFRMAGAMRRRGMSPEAIKAALLVENGRCAPPLEESEVEEIATKKITRYEPAPKRASSSSSPLPRVGEDDEDGAPKGIAGRLRAARGTLTTMRDRYGAAVEYLAEPYLALGELTIVAGPPESFKSWLMADLARAVHTGALWLGSIPVPRGGVLYFEQERARNLAYQLTLLEAGWAQDLGGLVAYEPCGIDLCHPDWQGAIRALVEAERPRLVVLNSYKAIFRGRPADSSDVAQALGWLEHLAERVRCAVCVVDGDNKAGALGAVRGMAAHADSVQKAYEADRILHVERKRDDLGRGIGPARVYLGKLRHGGSGEAPAPFVVDLVPFSSSSPVLRGALCLRS